MVVDILALIAEKWVVAHQNTLNLKIKTSSEHCNGILQQQFIFVFLKLSSSVYNLQHDF